jgi:hypothetical protein
MSDLRTYGLKIHYNATSRGHVEWTGGDELLYKELQFYMAQFRSIVYGLSTESWRLLLDELMFGNGKAGEPIHSVSWESMQDNPKDERPGCNFLEDHRTRMSVDGEKWLFERERRQRPRAIHGARNPIRYPLAGSRATVSGKYSDVDAFYVGPTTAMAGLSKYSTQ